MTKVHRGHEIEALRCEGVEVGVPLFCGRASASGRGIVFVEVPSRLAAADIAALRTVVNGGFIPHARQGGRFVDAVAVEGSKLEGTGFEKEQMGHIQVAFTS